MAAVNLRPYRVRLMSGLETTLMLNPDTVADRFPDAREVKPGAVETKTPGARPRRTKKTT